MTIGVSPAAASVTIGQVGTPTTSDACDISDNLQPSVTSGSSYVVPAVGTITSWSHFARSGTLGGPIAKLKVFRSLGGSTYQIVGGDGPRPLSPGLLNTFAASVPVKPGDVLGLWVPMRSAGDAIGCSFSAPGDAYLSRPGDLADGQFGDFAANSSTANRRVNVSAVLDPSNSFTLGDLSRNKKKGTAILEVNVPNAGQLDLSGKGVKRGGGTGATAAVTVPAAGTVELLIKAKGKKKRKLAQKGRVQVNVSVAYTPTGGNSATQSRKLKLRKKR